MSHPIEDRLRDAYQAKAAQLTEQRLDQLTAAREQGLDGLLAGDSSSEQTAELPVPDFEPAPARTPQHWIAPALAAAAVAALAIGVTAVSGMRAEPRPRPNPPASHVSTPPPSTSAPAPSPSATPTHTQVVIGPPYLPAGQTGSRSQVPWSVVGTGWRLMQREHATNAVPNYDSSLYLYDPAGGRYLITDSVPTGAKLVGWSPDGDRAMVMTYDEASLTSVYYQMQLRSGVANRVLRTGPSNFVSYTRPQGLAFLVYSGNALGNWLLYRYSTDGSLEFSYPNVVNGIQFVGSGAFYSSDGRELVVPKLQDDSAVLIGNDGHFIRTFPNPAGYQRCAPVKLWTAVQMLERCTDDSGPEPHSALIVQPLSGTAPQVLTDVTAQNGDGNRNAWQLSNGDVLLNDWAGCSGGGSTYDILEARTGAVRPLRWPPGIPPSSVVLNVSGDIATFAYVTPSGCDERQLLHALYSYNLMTGQTSKLFDGNAEIVGWPGDQS